MMNEKPLNTDVHPPREIARLFERAGVARVQSDTLSFLALAVLAGAFIALGTLFFVVVVTEANFGFGVNRLLGGLSFCLGLVLVVVAGAELFTGNNLMTLAWASRLITTRALLRSWVLAYVGNAAGSLGIVFLAVWAGIAELGGGAVGDTAVQIAAAKADLEFGTAFARGILCNALVCLAVWMATGGRSATDKILAVLFPITAFVAMGFEHSIANWFFLPYGLALGSHGTVPFAGVVNNLAAVTAGNIIGGAVLVGGLYWVAYLRKETGQAKE